MYCYLYFTFVDVVRLKWILNAKMTILTLFIHLCHSKFSVCEYFEQLWSPKQHRAPLTCFKISSFVFSRRYKVIQVWNDMGEFSF